MVVYELSLECFTKQSDYQYFNILAAGLNKNSPLLSTKVIDRLFFIFIFVGFFVLSNHVGSRF